MHYIGAGAYAACAYCTHLGEYSKILQKMIYTGNRCFLQPDDSLRLDNHNFPSKSKNKFSPPNIKTMAYIDEANAKYSAAETNKERKELVQQTGCKGSYALRMLPLHDRVLNTPIDPMHLIKNIVSHAVNLIAGNEDSCKVREEERSWVKDGQKKIRPAPFSLPKENVQLADRRAKRIIVPSGFDWHPSEIFSKNTGMKSHHWKQLSSNGILKFCLRGLLGKNQRKTMFKLFDVIKDINYVQKTLI